MKVTFAPVAPFEITISPQAIFTVTGAPATLALGQSSNTISLTPA